MISCADLPRNILLRSRDDLLNFRYRKHPEDKRSKRNLAVRQRADGERDLAVLVYHERFVGVSVALQRGGHRWRRAAAAARAGAAA